MPQPRQNVQATTRSATNQCQYERLEQEDEVEIMVTRDERQPLLNSSGYMRYNWQPTSGSLPHQPESFYPSLSIGADSGFGDGSGARNSIIGSKVFFAIKYIMLYVPYAYVILCIFFFCTESKLQNVVLIGRRSTAVRCETGKETNNQYANNDAHSQRQYWHWNTRNAKYDLLKRCSHTYLLISLTLAYTRFLLEQMRLCIRACTWAFLLCPFLRFFVHIACTY